MCGIGGIVRMTDKPIEASQITTLLLGLEQRGKEASGVVLVDKDSGDFHILKEATSANFFVEHTVYKEFLGRHLSPKTKIVMVHCRQHTVGTPTDNSNNHPVFAGTCAVVHNGCVSNHREMFNSMKLERKADVDSDIIRAIVDKEGLTHKAIRELSKLSGSIAAGIIDNRNPNRLLLLRSGNPLCLGVSDDHIIFASTQKVVSASTKTWVQKHGIWAMRAAKNVDFSIFPADSAWLIGPTEREWHQKFQTAAYCYSPSSFYDSLCGDDEFSGAFFEGGYGRPTTYVHGKKLLEAHTGSRPFRVALPDTWEEYYVCPSCRMLCYIDETNRHLKADELTCPSCKTSLKEATHVARMKKDRTSN